MSATGSSLAFVDSTYDEAISLTRDARDFFAVMESQARARDFTSGDLLLQSCEALRVTSRLTQIMAWVLVQKAVQKGEITRDQARQPKYRLSGQEVCEGGDLAFEGKLLPRLSELLDESLRLYERIARLDALYDRKRLPLPIRSGPRR